MAVFEIITTQEEQANMLEVLRKVRGTTISVKEIARRASVSTTRARYIIMDLVDAKRLERVPTKAFNEHYIRYSYRVLD